MLPSFWFLTLCKSVVVVEFPRLRIFSCDSLRHLTIVFVSIELCDSSFKVVAVGGGEYLTAESVVSLMFESVHFIYLFSAVGFISPSA